MVRARLREDVGDAFEKLFQGLSVAEHGSDFFPSIPMGRRGDLKCDGYLKSAKTVFQAYGPRSMDVDRLLNKMETDFEGAREHWGAEMLAWRFVHNADTLPSEAIRLLAKLQSENPHLSIEQIPLSEIVEAALSLPKEKLEKVVGSIPSAADLRRLNFEEIDDLMIALEAIEVAPSVDPLTIPSPEKLEYNRLPDYVMGLLRGQEIITRQFQAYFEDTHRTDIGNRAAEKVRREYERLRDNGIKGVAAFWGLIEFAGGLSGPEGRRRALLGFLAYLFFACEIFENVPSGEAA